MVDVQEFKTSETIDSRLNRVWSDVEDAEIELEFDKQGNS
jgi:hypothetical protein